MKSVHIGTKATLPTFEPKKSNALADCFNAISNQVFLAVNYLALRKESVCLPCNASAKRQKQVDCYKHLILARCEKGENTPRGVCT